MKAYIFAILTTLFLASSCVKEKLDDCPDPEFCLKLYFEYNDNRNRDAFDDRIESIVVIFYDKNDEKFHREYEFPVSELGMDRSKIITDIEPGDYFLVTWANNYSGRETMPSYNLRVVNFGENYVYHNARISADRLHYAPDKRGLTDQTRTTTEADSIYYLTVAPKGVTEHTVSFMSAYRTLNVFLKGFSEIGDDSREKPAVTVENLSSFYNCRLARSSEMTDFTRQATDELIEYKGVEALYGYAGFYIPHFDNDSPVVVEIDGTDSLGLPYHHEVTMNEILEELELTVWDGDDAIIDVLIELINGAWLEISLPKWKSADIGIGFEE